MCALATCCLVIQQAAAISCTVQNQHCEAMASVSLDHKTGPLLPPAGADLWRGWLRCQDGGRLRPRCGQEGPGRGGWPGAQLRRLRCAWLQAIPQCTAPRAPVPCGASMYSSDCCVPWTGMHVPPTCLVPACMLRLLLGSGLMTYAVIKAPVSAAVGCLCSWAVVHAAWHPGHSPSVSDSLTSLGQPGHTCWPHKHAGPGMLRAAVRPACVHVKTGC